jgi:hypothetical protein
MNNEEAEDASSGPAKLHIINDDDGIKVAPNKTFSATSCRVEEETPTILDSMLQLGHTSEIIEEEEAALEDSQRALEDAREAERKAEIVLRQRKKEQHEASGQLLQFFEQCASGEGINAALREAEMFAEENTNANVLLHDAQRALEEAHAERARQQVRKDNTMVLLDDARTKRKALRETVRLLEKEEEAEKERLAEIEGGSKNVQGGVVQGNAVASRSPNAEGQAKKTPVIAEPLAGREIPRDGPTSVANAPAQNDSDAQDADTIDPFVGREIPRDGPTPVANAPTQNDADAQDADTTDPFAGREIPRGEPTEVTNMPTQNDAEAQNAETADPFAGREIPRGEPTEVANVSTQNDALAQNAETVDPFAGREIPTEVANVPAQNDIDAQNAEIADPLAGREIPREGPTSVSNAPFQSHSDTQDAIPPQASATAPSTSELALAYTEAKLRAESEVAEELRAARREAALAKSAQHDAEVREMLNAASRSRDAKMTHHAYDGFHVHDPKMIHPASRSGHLSVSEGRSDWRVAIFMLSSRLT